MGGFVYNVIERFAADELRCLGATVLYVGARRHQLPSHVRVHISNSSTSTVNSYHKYVRYINNLIIIISCVNPHPSFIPLKVPSIRHTDTLGKPSLLYIYTERPHLSSPSCLSAPPKSLPNLLEPLHPPQMVTMVMMTVRGRERAVRPRRVLAHGERFQREGVVWVVEVVV